MISYDKYFTLMFPHKNVNAYIVRSSALLVNLTSREACLFLFDLFEGYLLFLVPLGKR